MNTICIAKFTAKKGLINQLTNQLKVPKGQSLLERGCIEYNINLDVNCNNTVMVYERYSSKEDFIVHSESKHLAKFKEFLTTAVESNNAIEVNVYSQLH